MRLNVCLTFLCVYILTVSILTVETDSKDYGCEIELRVRRNTVFNVSTGKDLKINCTVRFCNDSPPTISWYKLEKSYVPINVNSGSHIKTEWEHVKDLKGISYLIFKNILMSDSGVYQCRSGLIMGHTISVSVSGEDLDCETELRVRRNTVYEVFLGQDLKINCTVHFCSDSPPTISWYKLERSDVPVNVNSGSHIKTEWEDVKHLEGISNLIFKNILMSDSGVYRCQSGLIMGHTINVSVIVTSTTPSPTVQDILLPYVYRLAAVMVFLIILIIIWATSKYGCKGVCCAGRSRDKPDLSCQRSHRSLRNTHVYENDH